MLAVANQLLRLLNVALAVTGGVLLLKRRPAAVILLRVFAVLQILQLPVAPVLQWVTQSQFMGSPNWFFLWYGAGQLLLGLPWPVFLLVWLWRRKVRNLLTRFRDPAQRAALRPPTGSVWPVAVGLVVLIHCAGSIFTLAYSLLSIPILALMESDMPDIAAKVLLWYSWQYTGPQVFGVIGAILLLRRRRAAMGVLLSYAMLLTVTVIAEPAMMGWLYEFPEFREPMFLLKQMAIGLPKLVLPVFVMIWILLPAVRRQMRHWGRGEEN